jgi:glycosyltransferase involved in cell wall biosynthesis
VSWSRSAEKFVDFAAGAYSLTGLVMLPTEGATLLDSPGGAPLKLIIQIPCFNEAETLPYALADLPRAVEGFDSVEWLVIDDGSEDETARVARELGVDHVIRLPSNQGLARAFVTGIEACLSLGADVIVNTDGDNQYSAADIPALVAPVLQGADMVVGARPIDDIPHFSWLKRRLQRFGSAMVRTISGTEVRDAPSGFRAMSRGAAMRLHVFNDYTYTLETVIQAGHCGMKVVSVPVSVNPQLRSSRLIRNLPAYIRRQAVTMIRIFTTYRPFRFFVVPGAISFLAGFLIGVRFLAYFYAGNGAGHVQSLILAALLMGIGVALAVVGLVADLISVNRKLLEDVNWRLKRMEYDRDQGANSLIASREAWSKASDSGRSEP